MKTRIISGIVMAVIVASALALGLLLSPVVITAFIAFITAIGVYELLHNAAGIVSKTAIIGSCIYSVLLNIALGNFNNPYAFIWDYLPFILTVIYFLFAVVVILKNHKDFSLSKIAVFSGMPILLTYAFSTLGSIINAENGIYYLLLLLNFSSVCDMGAYFSGVTLGKHKLCPEISPKKTVEGAIGGIVSSLIVGVIIILAFSKEEKLLPTLIVTVPLCIVGMLGDLFASAIKRSVNLKDYGSLIPGHGGVLDRVDSILLIAPVMWVFVTLGVI